MTTIGIDWDGVLTSSPDWTPVPQPADFTLVREAHARGYAVVIITASFIDEKVLALHEAGFKAQGDEHGVHGHWDGGRDGRVILVTHRKVSATAYVDDRAIHHDYSRPAREVFETLHARQVLRDLRRTGKAVTMTRLP